MKKVAIIGMGVTGISVLREWTREKEKGRAVDITVFGDKKTFGRGVPYQQEDHSIIMNQPASLATMIPEKKYDFVNWLKENGEVNPSKLYSPRAVFGEYMKERMEMWLERSQAKIVKEKVKKIKVLAEDSFQVVSPSLNKKFDYIHLCIGISPYNDHYELVDYPEFIRDPFPLKESMRTIPKNARIGVLGTGLTSVDIIRYVEKRRPDLKLSLYSPSGRFKTTRGTTISYKYKYFTKKNIEKARNKGHGWVPLDTYLNWMKKEIESQDVQIESAWWYQDFGSKESIKRNLREPYELGVVQTLILGLDSMLTDIWSTLTNEDRHRFVTEYGEIWDKVRSSFPKESGELLVAEWENKSIHVYSQIKNVVKKSNTFEIILENKKSKEVEYLINGMGNTRNVNFQLKEMALLEQLLNERVIQPEKFGGIQVKMPDLSVVSQRYGVLDRFKAHGPLISGIQFGNNSTDILSETAKVAVQSIIQMDFLPIEKE